MHIRPVLKALGILGEVAAWSTPQDASREILEKKLKNLRGGVGDCRPANDYGGTLNTIEQLLIVFDILTPRSTDGGKTLAL
jgi:hypothetical protein